jgi:hypothetical protein
VVDPVAVARLFERIFAALRRCANTMRSIRISEGLEVPPAEAKRP